MLKGLIFISFLALFYSAPLYSKQYYGRTSIAAFSSDERFETNDNDKKSNDYLFISSRLFVKLYDFGNNKKDEFISDLRDKYDLYGKLDKEDQSLSDTHTFHIRKLQFKTNSQKQQTTFFIGRFPVEDINIFYNDGIQIKKKHNNRLHYSLWSGFNPRSSESSRPKFNSNSTQVGSYFIYKNLHKDRYNFLYTNNGYILQQYNGQTDRSLFHHNFIYRWGNKNRFFSRFIFDLIPRRYFQKANVSLEKSLRKKISSEINLTIFDAIEYRRLKDVRDKLESGQYQRGSFKIKFKVNSKDKLAAKISHGKRKKDSLERTEFHISFDRPSLYKNNLSLNIQSGYRDDFTKKSSFFGYSIGYFKYDYELNFKQDYIYEKYDEGKALHPLINELSLASFYSRSLFSTLSFQYIKDKDVTISTIFLKLVYRFGSRIIPQVREGLAPRGAL